MRNMIFVCGVGRSGTSALTELLNYHHRVVVGFERYKRRYKSINDSRSLAELFEEDRFFEYRPDDSNNLIENGKYDGYYRLMKTRFPDVRLIGDKVPSLYRRYDWIERLAPDAQVLHIVRDPVEVANSWDGRAARGGAWPPENDHKAAIAEWNFALKETLAAVRARELKIGIVRYAQLFSSHDDTPTRLLAWLGLEPSPTFDEGVEAMRGRARHLNKFRTVPDEVRVYVDRHADRALHEEMRAIAI